MARLQTGQVCNRFTTYRSNSEEPLALAIALSDCKALIAILARNYISSKFCKGELRIAWRNQKPIFPVVREEGWDAAVVPEECSEGVKYMKDACNLVRFLPSDDYAAALQELQLLLENVNKQGVTSYMAQKRHSSVYLWFCIDYTSVLLNVGEKFVFAPKLA